MKKYIFGTIAAIVGFAAFAFTHIPTKPSAIVDFTYTGTAMTFAQITDVDNWVATTPNPVNCPGGSLSCHVQTNESTIADEQDLVDFLTPLGSTAALSYINSSSRTLSKRN